MASAKPAHVGLFIAVGVLCLAGCGNNAQFTTEERLARGMIMILPGIEGPSPLNEDIRRGLIAAGCPRAMPVRSWGNPVPLLGVALKQIDLLGAHIAAEDIRDELVRYQEAHPGVPVYLVGHSGGGGIAVLVAEKMPEGHTLKGLLLLSASISSAHDLTEALQHLDDGIVNFYNKQDAAMLGVATTLFSNIDGLHGPAAGLIGFDWPTDRSSTERKNAYARLYQIELKPGMLRGGGDPHTVATRPSFVATYVAAWTNGQPWPAEPSERFFHLTDDE